MARLSVDIGGTFTDIVLEAGGRRRTTKLLTTPRAPEEAVLAGTRALLAEASLGFRDLALFVHGTTLATNALIERRGARVALIATEGFRDVVEIGDEGRYDQYDLDIDKPVPLVPRRLRFTVPERIDVHGVVRLPLDEAAVVAVAAALRREAVEAVAVAFLHAYADAGHERRVREILSDSCPGLWVTLASDVAPEIREYERTSTAIANAYVQPMMARYLGRLRDAFAAEGATAPIHLMTSGGSLASLDTASRFPIRLVESGPAGGAILAARVAAERGETRVLSFDMGGTTAKICLIERFEPLKSRSFEVDRAARFLKGSGLPVRIPVIEMIEIGAGGGSLARVDALRRITVGPDSAGSEPGPACYGRGGTVPAVTDADLVLGRIDPARFAGGTIALSPDAAARALDAAVGAPLALATGTAAYGVVEIVDENMANAARVHAVERGLSVREHTLIAFGGAAPLHAARLAEKLGIDRIIVPPDAGVGSAVGFLRAPAAYEVVRSRYMRLDGFDPEAANDLLGAMGEEAEALTRSAAGDRPLTAARTAFMRYLGQGHEIAVTLPARELAPGDAEGLREAFEAAYRRLFSRHIPGAVIEILTWAVAIGTDEPAPPRLPDAPPAAGPRPVGARATLMGADAAPVAIPVYARDDFSPGATVEGPAIVVEAGTSTFVSPAFRVSLDCGGALVLQRKATR
ncbi:Acetophenone carboxylase gamma subunit [Methylobacterium crusticola]|uniref:Acetophenone carboxylase gamma subunit n=1 Tax=Methylobacterium crusticola TaxID=1697972 RepID=A0ABQ4QWA8_9HYPH|nr:hydantoinase/oxoprolinase family protein [Methylobacterium crusticola]GJD49533.1 Acetophenone carboxylase gamma subunit [Methylobacterium crusticola]